MKRFLTLAAVILSAVCVAGAETPVGETPVGAFLRNAQVGEVVSAAGVVQARLTGSSENCPHESFAPGCDDPAASPVGAFLRNAPSHSPVKILSPALREVTFTDYDIRLINGLFGKLGTILESAPKAPARAPGCSGAVAGQFFGRNYDWMFSSADQYVIHVPAPRGSLPKGSKGRHASLGVATGGLLDPQLLGGQPLTEEQKMDILPYCTLDGINDAGLVVSDNIVPCGDHGFTTGTHPGRSRVNQLALVRLLLDNCATVKEAIALVRQVDLFSVPVLELHYLVLDASGASCVIEIVDNKVVVLENARVMTNFYLNDFLKNGTYTPHSMGIERYQTLAKGVGAVKSASDMVNLMAQVNFSLYVKPGNEKVWWSECNGYENPFRAEFPKSPAKFFHGDDKTFAEAAVARMKLFAHERASLGKARNIWKKTGKVPSGIEAWMSVHSSVYDAKARTLELRVLEQDDKPYRFAL